MIDLDKVRDVVDECINLIDKLDGQPLDERDAVTSQSRGETRKAKAQLSQDLQLLAHRFEMAASLVRDQYWAARGEPSPLNTQEK